MTSQWLRMILVLSPVFSSASLLAADLPPAIPVQGVVQENLDISAVVATDRLVLVGSDEKGSIQVLDRTASGFKAGRLISLLESGEADIEGMAIRRPAATGPFTVFVIGCHCGNRKTLKEDDKLAKNLEKLPKVDQEESRANVYRLTVDEAGVPVAPIQRISLSALLRAHPVLGRFAAIPSKENGIDIEGLAVGPDGKLFAGFRGPVLRGNLVPVLGFDFDHPDSSDLRFVNLGGLGIRDITAVAGGFLLLAGPVGEGRPDFRIFFWDGTDSVPGKDRPKAAVIKDLGGVPLPEPTAKAEGLAVLAEDAGGFDVLVVFDGVANGRPTRLRVVRKPG
jgi:hypothetical protein